MQLWQKILIGLGLGIIAGLLLGEHAIYLKPFGKMFISLIKMIIVPLIFFSLISAMTGMDDMHQAGKIGIKSFALYLVTTAFAICLGLALATFFNIGEGIELNLADVVTTQAAPEQNFMGTLVAMIPQNPIASMADGNVLQVIIFAIFLGLAINQAGEHGKRIGGICNAATEVIFKLTNIIMTFAPYGVFALIGWMVGTQDSTLILSLGKIVLLVYGACLLHIYGTYGLMVKFIAKVPYGVFFRKVIPAQLMAYSTSSSSATLPVTLKIAQESLGVSKSTASFVLPMGTTVNMDGTALYQGVCALFIAQAMGVDLSMGDYATIVFTATLASIGSAGVPGAGLIMLSLVLTSVGLPVEGVAIIAGIDRILDMARTTVNVTGDLTVALIVDKTEGHFDEKSYLNHTPKKS
jgi:Na+/H+-dicarboxylate symporter